MTVVRAYLFSQFLRACAAISLVLLAIGLIDVLMRLVRSSIDASALAYLAILYIINAFVGSVLPIGVYFGIFFAIGRLCQRQELQSLYGCGVPRTETRAVLAMIVAPVLLFSASVSFFIYPALKVQSSQASQESHSERIAGLIASGGVYSDGALSAMSAPARPGQDGRADRLLIYRYDQAYLIQIAEAEGAEEPARHGATVDSGQGWAYYRNDESGVTGSFRFEASDFLLNEPSPRQRPLHPKERNIVQLWRADSLADSIELQKRLLAPLLVLLCFVFAAYAAEILPRQSCYARMPQAVALLVSCFVSIRFGGDFIAGGILPLYPGLWLLLPANALLALALYRIAR